VPAIFRVRSIIERSIGILRRKFKLFKSSIELRLDHDQSRIIYACCSLHNFVRRFDKQDDIDYSAELREAARIIHRTTTLEANAVNAAADPDAALPNVAMTRLRDVIATKLCDDIKRSSPSDWQMMSIPTTGP